MRMRIAVVVVALLLMTLALAGPAAQAQGPCTLKTFTGTYAFYEKGASAILDPTPNPLYPYHWTGAIEPFITVGEITIGADGVGHGYFWIRAGALNGGPEAIPFETTMIEMNKDCTGKISAQFTLAGEPETIVERFIISDNGRQYRAIPISGGMPTLGWLHEGHRISKPGEPPKACGPQTANGIYLTAGEDLTRFPTTPILTNDMLVYMAVEMGEVKGGMIYEKFGPIGNIQNPIVSGTMNVNPDCSFVSTLQALIAGNPTTITLRGVFFDEGKKFYGVNANTSETGTQYSFYEGDRIGQY